MFTEDIIYSGAQLQESYFLKATLMPTLTYNEATVAASSILSSHVRTRAMSG